MSKVRQTERGQEEDFGYRLESVRNSALLATISVVLLAVSYFVALYLIGK